MCASTTSVTDMPASPSCGARASQRPGGCSDTTIREPRSNTRISPTVRSGRPPTPFRDFVAGPWKAVCYDRCKPSTQRNYGGVLKRELLPAFGSRRLDRITRSMTLSWFETCSRTAPGAANEALTLLGQILNHARASGHIEANPARGIKRNPVRKLTRFLSREEIVRLHRVLDRYAEGSRSKAQQADIIRLLLLAGCHKNEIVRLRRDEVKGDRLELLDSKTGPRTVLLNARAQEIVERRMAQGNGPWVFPSVEQPDRWVTLWTGYMGNSVPGLVCFRAARPGRPDARSASGRPSSRPHADPRQPGRDRTPPP